MVWLNRTLNILLLLGAGVSLIFGIALFKKRVELRDRGEKLADALAFVVKDLDTKSGTQYQKDVHRNEYTENGQTYSGGTLGLAFFGDSYNPDTQSYAQFDNVLAKVKNQTHEVRQQRDILASSIAEISALFDQANADETLFQNLQSYEQSTQSLSENLQSIKKRDDAIFSKIEELSNTIDSPIDKTIIADPEKFESALADFGSSISKLKERAVNYADTLSQAVAKMDSHQFEVKSDLLSDPEAYVGELASILNDFSNINEKLSDYETYKVEFLETKDTLERTVAALEASNDNLVALENKLANLESDYTNVRKRYNEMVGDRTKERTDELQKLEGYVINVDYDWNYVILNLGEKDSLPENLEMIVAREQEYICKVLVTRVFKDYAVAEILPAFKQGSVIEGDRVIF